MENGGYAWANHGERALSLQAHYTCRYMGSVNWAVLGSVDRLTVDVSGVRGLGLPRNAPSGDGGQGRRGPAVRGITYNFLDGIDGSIT